jgi:microcystin-dependent protein
LLAAHVRWFYSQKSYNSRITSELSKVFTKNVSDTEQHTASDKYLSIDKEYLKELSSSSSKQGGADVSFLGISVSGNGGSSSSSKNSFYDKLAQMDHQKYSKDDVVKLLNEEQVDFSWDGEKLIPKSFQVYKISDLTDSLQVALVAKQINVDKNQGAIIRHISTMNSPTTIGDSRAVSIFLTSEIKLYSGRTHPPDPWLFCNGSAVSRVVYQRLFATIGTTYGSGDGIASFNIPDFRGRVPVGVDPLGLHTTMARDLGLTGGYETHTITANQLPSHSHSLGSISMSSSGGHTLIQSTIQDIIMVVIQEVRVF